MSEGSPIKNYLPLRYKIVLFFVSLALWWLGVSLLLVLGPALVILFLFRQRDIVRTEELSCATAPVGGRVKSIVQKNGLVDVEVVMPWWGGMGIHLPFHGELKSVSRCRGKAFFRYDFFGGRIARRGVVLVVEEIGTSKNWEIIFGECPLGGSAHLEISPGDRGLRGASIGYFMLGGVVRMRFPANGGRVLVRRGQSLVAGKTPVFG